jgi:hypothetical protein
MKAKTGSKEKVTCQICGKVLTKAGLIGHMAWRHGKHHKAPMLQSKARPQAEVRRKASLYDIYLKVREKMPLESLRNDLEWERQKHLGDDKAYMAESVPLIEAYCERHRLTHEELYNQLAELYSKPRVTAEDIRKLHTKRA